MLSNDFLMKMTAMSVAKDSSVNLVIKCYGDWPTTFLQIYRVYFIRMHSFIEFRVQVVFASTKIHFLGCKNQKWIPSPRITPPSFTFLCESPCNTKRRRLQGFKLETFIALFLFIFIHYSLFIHSCTFFSFNFYNCIIYPYISFLNLQKWRKKF